MPDGKKTPAFGTKPTGMLVFTEDGRFIYLQLRQRALRAILVDTPDNSTVIEDGPILPVREGGRGQKRPAKDSLQ